MEEKKENIVKKVCRELGITQAELARMLKVSPHVISKWVTSSTPHTAKLALELMLENKKLKKHIKNIKNFYETIQDIEKNH